jgi:hypothetical protein
MTSPRRSFAPSRPARRRCSRQLVLSLVSLIACDDGGTELDALDVGAGSAQTEAGASRGEAGADHEPRSDASRAIEASVGAAAADAGLADAAGQPVRDAASDARSEAAAADANMDAAKADADTSRPDASQGDAGLSAVLVPAQGVLLGQYYGDGNVAATMAKLGRTLPIHLVYYTFTDDWTRGATLTDLNAGRIPLVNWELFETPLDDILSGKHDAMLATRARAAKALGKPFFVDFGAEMNGDWSPWGGAQNGQSATKYLAAYKRVHDAFSKESASNVVWLWCPNVTDEPRAAWNQALNYYPGDEYVDWTCVDGYNWGSSNGGGWQSFHDVFKTIYPKLAAKGKPIMIGEMASAEVGGDKAAWIEQIVPTLRAEFPLIKGLVWFDVNKETDWRISSSAKSESAFVRLVADPYTNP